MGTSSGYNQGVGILSLLQRYPTLRRLWVGAMISGLGDTFTWMALTWYLVERTKSGAAVGTMLLCFSLPTVLGRRTQIQARVLSSTITRALTCAPVACNTRAPRAGVLSRRPRDPCHEARRCLMNKPHHTLASLAG